MLQGRHTLIPILYLDKPVIVYYIFLDLPPALGICGRGAVNREFCRKRVRQKKIVVNTTYMLTNQK
jgi:hypothetical protein